MAVETPIQSRIPKKSKKKKILNLKEHIVEIVSDSGEGAQKCGQTFGTVSAKMGNGLWTVEIIPAEIQPPPRIAEGASGIRIRIGSFYITNAGDESDLVIAFNEQVLKGRVKSGNLKPGCKILLENFWREHPDPSISQSYKSTYEQLIDEGYEVYEIPMEVECLKYVSDARRGKNMFALGVLCNIYNRDLELGREQIRFAFQKKGDKVVNNNLLLFEAGSDWAENNLDFGYEIPSAGIKDEQIVINGNNVLALGIMASGMEVCAMYPITPATSASHYLTEIFENVGGIVHQAEDEIAACAFAIGASYAGKCACTITSGPGMSLKTELIGLASMA